MARRNGETRPPGAKAANPFSEPFSDDDEPVQRDSGGTAVDPVPSRPEGTEPRISPPTPSPPPKRRTADPPHPAAPAPRAETPEPRPAAPGEGTRVLDARAPTVTKGSGRGELVVRSGPVAGLQFTLHAGAVVVVGRSSQADCTIPDEAVSRRHFEVRITPAGVFLRDLGSGNGTLVNGKRVEDMQLTNGDRIVVGDSTIEFRDRNARSKDGTAEGMAQDDEPETWFLGRLPEKQRRFVVFAVVMLLAIIIVGLVGIGQNKKRAEERRAIKAFQRGRQEMSANPPDPDAALDDFQYALQFYPDPQMVREAIVEAQGLSSGIRQMAHARELIDLGDLDGARRQLQGLPRADYFVSTTKLLEGEIAKRAATKKAEEEEKQKATLDPTTLAEVQELLARAKKNENQSPDAALAAYEQAYDMLSKRGATGPVADKVKSDYVALLLRTSQALKRRNPTKSIALEGKARSVSPEAVAAVESPTGQPQIRPIVRAPPPAPKAVKKKHHAGPPPKTKAAAGADDDTTEHKPAAASKYDDDRADQLDDEGDALIGQDPDAAKKKYSEALKYARPGSQAANRAREGLNN